MFNRFSWTESSLPRIQMTNLYEPLQPYLFLSFADKIGATVVIDVGANVGQYSILATGLLPTHPSTHAFEAEEVAARTCAENIHLNGLETSITLHGLAVSDRVQTLKFGVASAMAGNNSALDTSIHDHSVFTEIREVPATSLDTLLHLRDERIAAKIDIEGHEALAIQGATKLFSRNLCLLQVEIYQPGEVDTLLNELGYSLIFHAGPDHYFTNASDLASPATVIDAIQEAIQQNITYNLHG